MKKAVDKEQIKKIIKLREKRSFIKSYLVKDVERIKNLYSSAGYNSSNVEIKIKQINDESFDLLIEIDRGNKLKSHQLIYWKYLYTIK